MAFMKRLIFKTLSNHQPEWRDDETVVAEPQHLVNSMGTSMPITKRQKRRSYRIKKEALTLLHSELEKYATEIFMVAGMLGEVSGHTTLHSAQLKNAVLLRATLIQTLG